MKLIVFSVVSIAVFRANCGEPPDNRDLNNVGHEYGDFSESGDLYFSSDLPDGPKDEDPTTEPELFTDGPVDHISSADVDMAVPTVELGPEPAPGGIQNYESSNMDHQLKEDGTVQYERKLRGGSKCKPDIMCSLLGGSCISNSTFCSGRELPSLCGGAKCKCCITVNLEVRMHDVETEIQAMIVNISVANSNLNTKLNSIMDFIISANSSQATVNSNLEQKIDSLMSTNSNLTIANSNMKNKLDFIMGNVTNANAIQETKLDSIMEHQGCPEGMFWFSQSNQCFKRLNTSRYNWATASQKCQEQGLELAKPYDPISLTHYLLTRYGREAAYTWVGAKGTGSTIKWQRDGATVWNQDGLFYHGSGGTSTNHCLGLLTESGHMKNRPDKPYYTWGCTSALWSLCELVH